MPALRDVVRQLDERTGSYKPPTGPHADDIGRPGIYSWSWPVQCTTCGEKFVLETDRPRPGRGQQLSDNPGPAPKRGLCPKCVPDVAEPKPGSTEFKLALATGAVLLALLLYLILR